MKIFSDYTSKDFIVLLLILGAISLGVISILRERIVDVERNQIIIRAEGRVMAKPDIAKINFGYKTDTIKEVKDTVSVGVKNMNQIVAAIKNAGVEEKDIKTTNYNLQTIYEYPQASGKAILSGYQLEQQISVKIRDISKIGDIINAATNAGANQSGGINFTIDDPDQLKAEALKNAIDKAELKAKQISKESGIRLGKLINVYEYDYGVPSFNNDSAFNGIGGAMMKAEAVPTIEAGDMEVKINVELTYKVK